MKNLINITLLVPVLLLNLVSTTLAATKLEFVEQTTSFSRTDNGDGIESVGDREEYTSVLLVPGTETVQGTKETKCLLNRVTPSGEYVIFCTETISLLSGNGDQLFAAGEINLTGKFFKFKPQRLDIIGGTGIYSSAKGKETITRLDPEPGRYSVELKIN
jgi:hypothetical protein